MMSKVTIRSILALHIGIAVWSSSIHSASVQWEVADGGNGHFYEAFTVLPGTDWNDISAAVEAMGGGWHLATITSAEENSFIFDLVSGKPEFWFCCTAGTINGPYLGAKRGTSGFEWVTGEPFSYTNWASREPFGNGQNIAFWGPSGAENSLWNDIGPIRGDIISYVAETSVPIPAAIWLFGSSLLGLIGISRRTKAE